MADGPSGETAAIERARRNRCAGRAPRGHRAAVEDWPGGPDPRRNVCAWCMQRACRRSTRHDETRTATMRRADVNSATARSASGRAATTTRRSATVRRAAVRPTSTAGLRTREAGE